MHVVSNTLVASSSLRPSPYTRQIKPYTEIILLINFSEHNSADCLFTCIVSYSPHENSHRVTTTKPKLVTTEITNYSHLLVVTATWLLCKVCTVSVLDRCGIPSVVM